MTSYRLPLHMQPFDKLNDRSYGNTGTPITMDMGGWNIFYMRDGIEQRSFLKEGTLLNTVAVFNSLERTSGFDTPLRIERLDIFGNHTDTWTMEGRYGVPHHVTSKSRTRGNSRRRHNRSRATTAYMRRYK